MVAPVSSSFAAQFASALARVVTGWVNTRLLDGRPEPLTFDADGTTHEYTLKVEGWDTCIRVIARVTTPHAPLAQTPDVLREGLQVVPAATGFAMQDLKVGKHELCFILVPR